MSGLASNDRYYLGSGLLTPIGDRSV